eukprot:CFRG5839T1
MQSGGERKKRSFWGWGYEDHGVSDEVINSHKKNLKGLLDIEEFENIVPPTVDSLNLRKPRFSLPSEIQDMCKDDTITRASHSYGKSFRDIWRGLNGVYENPPDYVAFPKTENDLKRLLLYAASSNVACVPFGGGTSTVGGVEPTKSNKWTGVITIDMLHFDNVLEVDTESRCAHVQSGIFGPSLDRALKPYGLTMRHFPQSYEFSTLGGWISTRSGGHFATNYTHIDEFVQSIRMLTADGEAWETRRLPGNGAGPSEERLICGSEGTFGIITSAWVRLQAVPIYKLTQNVEFKTWEEGVEACRILSQSGLFPTNCRLVSKLEALFNRLGNGDAAVLLLGFESHQHDVTEFMRLTLDVCKANGGTWKVQPTSSATSTRISTEGDAIKTKAGEWKSSFLTLPYIRDEMMKCGLVMDTFETAIVWEKFTKFHAAVEKAASEAVSEHCGVGYVTCRFTHLYPDGPAPYYTVIGRGTQGKQLEQWDAIKEKVSQVIIDNGGTITHHHAVGRDHVPWYSQQHTKCFDGVLHAIKKSVDVNGVMNPGVLFKDV